MFMLCLYQYGGVGMPQAFVFATTTFIVTTVIGNAEPYVIRSGRDVGFYFFFI